MWLFSVGIREWPTECELFGHDQHNANELPISQTHLYIYTILKEKKCTDIAQVLIHMSLVVYN